MSIVQDMDAEWLRQKPNRAATWLIGGNVWHALIADLVRINRDNGAPVPDPEHPPEFLFGLRLKHVRRMTGWGLAEPLDAAELEEHEHAQGVDAHAS